MQDTEATCPFTKQVGALNKIMFDHELFIDNKNILHGGDVIMDLMRAMGKRCNAFVEGEDWVNGCVSEEKLNEWYVM